MGELAASIICENDMEGWTLDGLNSNSMLGKVRNEEIYVFVLSNHFAFNGNLIATIGLLKKVHFHVTGALLGSFNSGFTKNKVRSEAERISAFQRNFPGASVRAVKSAAVLGNGCKADFHDCSPGGSHQCLPGPGVISHSQGFVGFLVPLKAG